MIKSIKSKNFLSWKNLEFSFESGITLLTGWNKQDNTAEASGKSSIPNMLTWGLFGCLPKDAGIDQVIHTGEKSCMVEITLDNGTIISRTRNPNKLYIQNGSDIQTGKDLRDTQKLVDNIIGMSFETFVQTVYYPQGYANKFITANEENKAKILSELQDLSVFDRASKKTADILKDLKLQKDKLTATHNHQRAMIKVYQEQFDTFCGMSDTYDADKLKQLDDIVEKSLSIGDKMKAIESEISTLGEFDTLIDKQDEAYQLRQFLSTCEQKLYNIEQIRLQSLSSKDCPTCKRPMTDDNCILEVPDNSQLLFEKEGLTRDLNSLMSDIDSIQQKLNKRNQLTFQHNGLIEQRKLLSTQVNRIEGMHNPYLDKIKEFNDKVQHSQRLLSTVNEELTQTTSKISHLEFLKEGWKEIKSYVFQGLLDELNRKTNAYLTKLFDITATLEFKNDSEDQGVSKIRTTVKLDGIERTLGLLSGGQMRRVQLAVDFALSDIVSERSNKPINLRILDESFKDLSEASLERVIEVLKDMKGSTLVIEHNSIIKSIVDRTHHIVYDNGVSNFEQVIKSS